MYYPRIPASIHFLFFFLLILFRNYPATYGMGVDTVEGVYGVAVIVENLSDSLKKEHFDSKNTQQVVMKSLSEARIRVFEVGNWYKQAGGGFLRVRVVSSKSKDKETYVMYISMELNRPVVIMSNELGKSRNVIASTWSVGKLFSCKINSVQFCINSATTDLTDIFINDYISVNQKHLK